jgi:mRNA interferase RelE/StbE
MVYRVVIGERAGREIRKLPKDVQRRVVAKAEALANDPRPPGCKKLEGLENLYRVRAGDHRIVYRIDDGILLVLIVTIGNRADVYERLRRMRRR